MAKKKTDDAGVGHNGGPPIDQNDTDKAIARIVPRIEALLEERAGLNDDIKDQYAEAKGFGVDVKILRKAIAARKAEREKAESWAEVAAELDRYLAICKS